MSKSLVQIGFSNNRFSGSEIIVLVQGRKRVGVEMQFTKSLQGFAI